MHRTGRGRAFEGNLYEEQIFGHLLSSDGCQGLAIHFQICGRGEGSYPEYLSVICDLLYLYTYIHACRYKHKG